MSGKKRTFFKKKTYAKPSSSTGNSSSKNNENQIQFDLGVEKKKVTVRKFKNMKLIDIREYYNKDDKWLPGSKGISLTEDQWLALVSHVGQISEALNKIDDEENFQKLKKEVEDLNAQKLEEEEEEEEETDDGVEIKNDEDDEEDLEGVEFEDIVEKTIKKVKNE